MAIVNSESLAFRPKARLLKLLGDELIRDPNIAIFELVKNAYDAGAGYARVTLVNIDDRQTGLIIVDDDGTGMDWDTLTGVWLEPGTDFRKRQRDREDGRSPKFGRLPLGEKGVGRFAAGKLGDPEAVAGCDDCLELAAPRTWPTATSTGVGVSTAGR